MNNHNTLRKSNTMDDSSRRRRRGSNTTTSFPLLMSTTSKSNSNSKSKSKSKNNIKCKQHNGSCDDGNGHDIGGDCCGGDGTGSTWYSLPDEIRIEILSYFPVRILVKNKQVCTEWNILCTKTITMKRRPETAKVFTSTIELRTTIQRYMNCYNTRSTRTRSTLVNHNHNHNQPTIDERDEENDDGNDNERDDDDHHYSYDPLHCSERTTTTSMNDTIYEEDIIAATYGWPIGIWDVSRITDFSYLFIHTPTFNESINYWNISNARTICGIFLHCYQFNQPLDLWDTSSVQSMEESFCGTIQFNQNISMWDTSQVTNMKFMFLSATSFQGIGFENDDTDDDFDSGDCNYGNGNGDDGRFLWDVSNVTCMDFMFCDTHSFHPKSVSLSKWNISPMTSMSYMLCDAKGYLNNENTNDENENENNNDKKTLLLQEIIYTWGPAWKKSKNIFGDDDDTTTTTTTSSLLLYGEEHNHHPTEGTRRLSFARSYSSSRSLDTLSLLATTTTT